MLDEAKFALFDNKISELAGNVIRKKVAWLIYDISGQEIDWNEAYNSFGLGIQIPETRHETLETLERKIPEVAESIMNYFIETPANQIELSLRKSVFD